MKKIRQKIISPFQTILSEGVVKISLCCFLLMFMGMQGNFAQTLPVFDCQNGTPMSCADPADPLNCTAPNSGFDCAGGGVGNAIACGLTLIEDGMPNAPVVVSESSCQPDGTAGGGSIDYSGVTCVDNGDPAATDLVLEFSTDGGATWVTTPPVYDQENAITVMVRCLCSEGNISTQTAMVTTVPVVCPPDACEIAVVISNVVCDAGADPDNPVDDMVTFDYTVTDVAGTGTTWSSDQGDAGAAYGTTVTVGPVPADGSAWTVNVTDDGDATCTASATQSLTDCGSPTDIPTLSEWGLITLALLLMTFGSVKMAVGSVALASTGSRNIPVPGTNNFQLPFDAAVFRKATTFTGILAIIGFAICFAFFGTIFVPDVIGVLIAGPVFAYLAHLLYILETRKGN